MSSSVDQIKAKLDIVSVVGGYMKLEKAGSNFKGRCPFHNEKTPSFFVSPDRGSYYCFGCQAKGDIFTFVEEFEGLDFKGALLVLADRAGVTLDTFSPEEKSDKDVLFSLMDQAAFYFEKNLSEQSGALEYLKSRGVTDETIRKFRLGYATESWRGLYEYLLSKGAKESDIERAGLIKRKEGQYAEQRYYDTFRSRIMFPIADSSGRVVAFSGRIFPDDPDAPKYLNSPETPIFRKSEVLYGLDKAKKDIHAKDYSILVEGQMDLVMLHQSGLSNAVASSGTALTETHLMRLDRLSHRLIMAFDGDAAGFKAMVRGAEIALSLGMEVKVAVQPEGSDPADMAKNDKEKLLDSFRESRHIITFILDRTVVGTPDNRILARKVAAEVLPFVARLKSASEQSYFIREIQSKTGIAENALWEDLRSIRMPQEQRGTQVSTTRTEPTDRSDLIIRKLLGILWWQSEKKEPDIDTEKFKKDIIDILGEKEFEEIAHSYKTHINAAVYEAESYYAGSQGLTSDILELINTLSSEHLKKRQVALMNAIRKAESTNNREEAERLSSEFNEIAKKIHNLKHK